MLVIGREAALGLERAQQRSHLAAELDVIDKQPAAADSVGERDPAVLDGEPVEAKPIEVEAGLAGREAESRPNDRDQ